ncbi:hypothetical protein ABS772_23395 [Methylorubrum podarium]|uniref:Uncharacterized protein n=1 Tax=Methylorubrum podarium TaxID=200476 RepID=A0ABV1QTX2_9HYPH
MPTTLIGPDPDARLTAHMPLIGGGDIAALEAVARDGRSATP